MIAVLEERHVVRPIAGGQTSIPQDGGEDVAVHVADPDVYIVPPVPDPYHGVGGLVHLRTFCDTFMEGLDDVGGVGGAGPIGRMESEIIFLQDILVAGKESGSGKGLGGVCKLSNMPQGGLPFTPSGMIAQETLKESQRMRSHRLAARDETAEQREPD